MAVERGDQGVAVDAVLSPSVATSQKKDHKKKKTIVERLNTKKQWRRI